MLSEMPASRMGCLRLSPGSGSWFQLPAHVDPGRKQVMAQAVGSPPPTEFSAPGFCTAHSWPLQTFRAWTPIREVCLFIWLVLKFKKVKMKSTTYPHSPSCLRLYPCTPPACIQLPISSSESYNFRLLLSNLRDAQNGSGTFCVVIHQNEKKEPS